jgi:restriction endonuclease Mrr
VRLEREVQQLADRYRDVARRAVLRQLQELPHRAIGELVALLLEHVGFSALVPVRRPGAHGAELHLSGKLRTPAGEIRTAVVVRRDGREIGRERVTELRGALHHYGPASAAWLVTTGQVLSGAREEAASPGASPLTVIDGLGLVRLCEDHGVGVVRTEVPLLLPDLDLLDGLRAS